MISTFSIVPSYYDGHLFGWTVPSTFHDPRPWTFTVQMSPDGMDRWEDHSPPVVNLLQWQQESCPPKSDKDLDPFYRVVLVTGDGNRYESAVKGVYGDLPRRDYLIAKEIMRKEHLMMRKSSGVEVDVWKKMKTGIKCTYCTDPVTGEVNNTKCPYCFGSQYEGGYNGPYRAWARFSLRISGKRFAEAGYGISDDQILEISLLGHPFLNEGDVVVDRKSDRRYETGMITSTVEIRRVPLLITVRAHELTIGDRAYHLGHEGREDDSCGNSRVY